MGTKEHMGGAPKISVVMPMYNVAQYIGPAIKSILAQSFANFELIIVDDGSTDDSYAVARTAIAGHRRCRIIAQENKGLGAARNIGMAGARGEFLYFFDADDLLHPDALQICVDLLQNLKLDLVVFSGEVIADVPSRKDRRQQYLKPDILSPIPGCELFTRLFKEQAYSASACLYMFPRSLIEHAALLFDEGVLHEDEGFTPLLYSKARRAVSLSKVLFSRRVRQGSIMTSKVSYRNCEGRMRAAYKILVALNSGSYGIGNRCRWSLASLQRRLLRLARSTAETLHQRTVFIEDIRRRFGLRNLIVIDLWMALYVYINPLFRLLRSVKRALLGSKGSGAVVDERPVDN